MEYETAAWVCWDAQNRRFLHAASLPPPFFIAQGDVDLFEFEAVLNCVTTGRSGVGTNRIPQLASGGSDSEEAEAQEAQEAEAGDFRATFCWHSFLLKNIVSFTWPRTLPCHNNIYVYIYIHNNCVWF